MDLTRVLIVDDNDMFIEMASFILGAAAYVVESASDASQALLKLPVFLPDLILMDVQMPVMDGLEATRCIRAQPAYAALPILAMTANAFVENKDQCFAAGMDDFIAKPVIPEVLYESLLRWLEKPGQ